MDASYARGKTRSASALAILAALLFANLLCVAPRLHEKIHRPSANHECAVTLIASGKYEHNAAPALPSAPQSLSEFSPAPGLHPVWVAAPFLNACIFEHAPPASV
jgi:hypothetical protein